MLGIITVTDTMATKIQWTASRPLRNNHKLPQDKHLTEQKGLLVWKGATWFFSCLCEILKVTNSTLGEFKLQHDIFRSRRKSLCKYVEPEKGSAMWLPENTLRRDKYGDISNSTHQIFQVLLKLGLYPCRATSPSLSALPFSCTLKDLKTSSVFLKILYLKLYYFYFWHENSMSRTKTLQLQDYLCS